MKKWVKYVIGMGTVLCFSFLLSAIWVYFELEPSRHFSKMEHPVLSESKRAPPGEFSELEELNLGEEEEKASFNILILGIDTWGMEVGRTDAIMVAHVDPIGKEVNLVSIPRDTRVHLADIGYTKINHAHVVGNLQEGNDEGTEAVIRAVSNLLHIDINYYVKVDLRGFQEFIDLIGGIHIELPQAAGSLPAGLSYLDGEMALELVRERKTLPKGDMDRQANQALVLMAITEKVLEPIEKWKIPKLIEHVKEEIAETNLTTSDVLSLAWLFRGMTRSQFEYVQLPGKPGMGFDPLIKAELYYWLPDEEEIGTISKHYLYNQD